MNRNTYILFLFFITFGLSYSSYSQVTIFTDDFETDKGWLAYRPVSNASNEWARSTTCPITTTSMQYKRNSCEYCWNCGSGNEIIYKQFSAVGLSSVTLDFKWKGIAEGPSYDWGYVVYSTNGTSWTIASAKLYGQSGTQTVTGLNLSALDNQSTAYIGFQFIHDGADGGDPAFVIDDVVIKGTDAVAPTHDNLTVNSTCWITDNAHDYTITIVSTETIAEGGPYGMMALVNYDLGSALAGGYFAWHPTAYTHTDNQMAAIGGGFASKAATWGGDKITLISCNTSLSGNQRTVNFVVRPQTDFIASIDNDVSMYTSDLAGNVRGWTLYETNFTAANLSITSVTPQTDMALNSELGEIDIVWSGASTYDLKEASPTPQTIYSGAATSFAHTGLNDETSYCYTIGSGSCTSAQTCATTKDRTKPPSDELSLMAQNNANNRIDASWTNSGNKYGLLRSESTNGTYTPVGGIYDNFTVNSSADYTASGDLTNITWTWSGGRLIADTDPALDGGYSYLDYDGMDVSGKDILVEYDMMTSGGNDWGGLRYRGIYCDINTSRTGWRDASGFYYSSVGANSAYHNIKMYIYASGGGDPTTTLFVDDELVFKDEPIDGSAWSNTKIGFVSSYYDYDHYYDNFKVSPIQTTNTLQDTEAKDVSAPNTPALPTVTTVSSTELQISWVAPTDNGDDYYYYQKSYDSEWNDNNVLLDCSIEKGTLGAAVTGWGGNLTLDNTHSISGNYSGKITNAGPGEKTQTNVGLAIPNSSVQYRYGGYIYSDGPSAQIFFFSGNSGGAGIYDGTYDNIQTTVTGEWVYIEGTSTNVVPADNIVTLRIDNNSAGNVWFDRLFIYAVKPNTVTTGLGTYYVDETSANPGASDYNWGSAVTYNDAGLSPNTEYCYKVKPKDLGLNEGAYSAEKCAYTDPSCVTAFTSAADGCDKVILNWSGGVHTNVRVHCTTTSTDIYTGSLSTYTHTGLDAGTGYSYEIYVRGVLGAEVGSCLLTNTFTVDAPDITIASSQSICTGGNVTLTSSANGGSGTMSYQWQYLNGTWQNLGTATTQVTGVLTATTQYRCLYSSTGSGCNTATSNTVTITVNADPSITIATTQTICSGDDITLTSSVGGGAGTMSYQWQYDNSGWQNMGTSSTQATGAVTSTTLYRCTYSSTGNGCGAANSNTVTLTIDPLPTGGSVSGGTTPICFGAGTGTMTLSGHSGIIIKWQKQLDGGGWNDIANTATTFSETPSSVGTWEYRAVLGECAPAYSAAKTIVVKSLSTAPTAITPDVNPICSGSSATLTPSGGVNGTGAVFQWFSGSCGGTALGSGNTKIVSPTSTTTYYVRREGDCNTTACANTSITVYTVSPAVPVATAASGVSSGQFVANWNAVANVTNYYLDVSPNSAFTSFVTGNNNKDVGTSTSDNVTGLNANTPYYYRVRAGNTCGTSSSSNTILVITTTPAIGLFVDGHFSNSGVFEQGNGDYINMTGTSKELKGSAGSFVNVNLIINGGDIDFNPAVEMLNEITNTYINSASILTILSNRKYKNETFLNLPGGTLNLNATSYFENSGNWTNSATVNANASSTVTFNGAADQSVTSGTMPTNYGNVVFNQTTPADINLLDDMTIATNGTFTSGVVQATATEEIIFNNGATSTVTSGIYPAPYPSFVNGPVKKIGTNDFTFPTGKVDGAEQEYRSIAINNVSASETFVAEYFHSNPIVAIGPTVDVSLDHISLLEYWILDRSGTNNAEVVLSWNNTWSGGVSDINELVVARYDGAKWVNENQSAFTGNNTSGTVSSNLVTSFSPFTLSSKTRENPLEIDLMYFHANCDGNSVELDWTTASETNNDYFTLDRSADAETFESFAVIEGAGNSNQILNYRAIDDDPYSGVSYYRLKQTDFDGKYTYFKMIPVECIASLTGDIDFNVYPNPASYTEDIYVHLDGIDPDKEVLIVVLDILGKEYYSKVVFSDINGFVLEAMDIHNRLASGIYVITATSNDVIYKRRVVVR